MSRLVLTAVGGDLQDTVTLAENPDLHLAPGDVLVEVDAAPVNNADLLFTMGWFSAQPRLPQPLGAEGVGRVIRAGEDVDQTLVGRRVLILPTFVQGTWTDQVVVPASTVVPLPVTNQADALQLAMLPVNPATAYALLHDYATLRPGDWIGLNLANSAVGNYVIALAKRAGIRTLAVVRRESAAEQVRALGADAVVVDGADLGERISAALGGERLRLALEGTTDPEQTAALVRSLEDGGTVVTFAAATGQAPSVPVGDLIYRGIVLRAFFILNWIRDTPRKELEIVYTELADLVEQGVLTAPVEATYPLEDHRAALAHAAKAERSGKILFVPRDRS
ncbi:zinc-dependent alcohol dehydrogenase family protein [Microbispora sp. RL4-1S]|uniref:enoyl-[acyl-carrier-protein] reductase n=1 Tax=Microbispora oryzae TaxID=2806554 RepID=A0A941ALB9_9ACTN|nr:zinc-dependent alcohol dehydrogenase family protein [Microbispora oryzae]MBP2706123.1 zinc-dependent alcohol dehydrogenase family protein [Microbispora oryzae]